MSVVPNSRLGKIEFYESHLPAWTTNAVAIGLTTTSVSSLSTLTTAARAAYNAAETARNAAKAATQAFYEAVRAMHSNPGAGSDMIDTIRNFAESKNQPSVYTLAQIPPPAAPAPVGPPGTPFDFVVTLLQSGALKLRWKCNNPGNSAGTLYEIMRKTPASDGYVFVGAAGSKTFTDETLMSGDQPAQYMITAVRSTQRGNPAQFVVSFGVGGGGGGVFVTNVTGTQDANVRMAA